MKLKVKRFSDLNNKELYEILKSRAEIFIVEQNCIYQDLDDIDYNSIHIFYEDNNRIIAYLRAFIIEKNVVQVGRVLTLNHGEGLGRKLLEEGISVIIDKFECRKIIIEAQKYAIEFYEKFGFVVVSDEFMEDGIIHVIMELVINK